MLKYSFSLIILFVILLNNSEAQYSDFRINGKPVALKDSSFRFSDAIQEIFYENNGQVIWDLRAEFSNLHFDHCNHKIQLLIYLDTTSEIKYVQIAEGSGIERVDSVVISRLITFSGKFIPVNYNNQNIRALIYLRLKYFDKLTEERMPQKFPRHGSDYLQRDIRMKTYVINNGQRTNDCEDDLYFYNEGLKYYEQQKFSKAIYNFSEALKANSWNLDALYNLGVAYQKSDNNKKACKCFQEGIELGDANSLKAFNKYCLDK